MTPHELQEAEKKARNHVADGGTVSWAVYQMLLTLLRHEADKEAVRQTRQS